MTSYDSFMRQHMHGKYPHMDAAISDINNTIYQYKDLKVKFDFFHYNDGTSKQLINLTGTIPVSYKNNVYNIPVALWIQEQHPVQAPICYVQPTRTMQVRQGKHVDMNGRIYLSYLTEWKSQSHSITGCIQMMRMIFGQEPPVFSRQSNQQQPQQQPANFPQMQRLPYPPAFQPTAQGPPTTNYQPTRPPYPMTAGGSNRPPYPQVTQQTNYLPYPNYPSGQPRANVPYPTPVPVGKKEQLDETMILASLRTAVNDKLKRRMRDTYSQATQELTNFKRVEGELKQGKVRVEQIEKTLKDEIQQADGAIMLLQGKCDELQAEIDVVEQKQDDLEADDYVMPTTPVYKQVVTSYAEEQALEDLIYHLSVAYHKERVDLETLLKHVRSSYREQFKHRAVIEKARKTAGLVNTY